MQIFVYGSLRRGQWAHEHVSTSPFVGSACTQPHYELVDLGRYPGLLRNGQTAIVGEIYNVSETTLQQLDRFEGHPTLFSRGDVALEDGRTALAYFANVESAGEHPRIASGDWCRNP